MASMRRFGPRPLLELDCSPNCRTNQHRLGEALQIGPYRRITPPPATGHCRSASTSRSWTPRCAPTTKSYRHAAGIPPRTPRRFPEPDPQYRALCDSCRRGWSPSGARIPIPRRGSWRSRISRPCKPPADHQGPATPHSCYFFFFLNDTATTEIYTLSLHDALLL